jgi:hypothetical protein
VPLPASQLSNLVSLALIGRDQYQYVVKDPHALWQQLPALRCLKLQFVQISPARIVVSGDPDIDADARNRTLQACMGPPDTTRNCMFNKLDGIAELWIEDLPCRRLQQLELAQYKLVVERSASYCSEQQGIEGPGCAAAHTGPAGQQAAGSSAGNAAGKRQAVCSSSQAAPLSGSNSGDNGRRGCSLSGLRQLRLVSCMCWVAEPMGRAASGLEYRVEFGCPSDVLSLLQDSSGATSNLKCLELWHMDLRTPDMEFLMCSLLADQLQLEQLLVSQLVALTDRRTVRSSAPRAAMQQVLAGQLDQLLVIQPGAFTGGKDVGSSAPTAAAQQVPELDEIVAAAAKAGNLQQLKALCVLIRNPARQDCIQLREHSDCGRQGHFAFWGDTGPLPEGRCKCFRYLRERHF